MESSRDLNKEKWDVKKKRKKKRERKIKKVIEERTKKEKREKNSEVKGKSQEISLSKVL